MKLDMGQAWSQAVAMLSANRDLVGIVAGVFFFLPYLLLMMLVPDLANELPVAEPGADPQVMLDALTELYSRIWLPMLLMVLAQSVGSLALLALLRDSTRPTLGEALKLGAIAFLPYLAAQLIISMVIVLTIGVLVGAGAAINPALAVLLGFVAVVGAIYLIVKFSLTMPVIAIDRSYNPVAALGRSWRLTKGNSLRLFFFFFLIIITGVIVTAVIQMIFGLVFALLGAEGALIGNGIVSAVLNAVLSVVLLAALAASHRQLAGGPGAAA